MYGNMCFEKIMQNDTIEENCDCPVECNHINYSFNLVSTPFDPYELCPSASKKEDHLMKEFYDKGCLQT